MVSGSSASATDDASSSPAAKPRYRMNTPKMRRGVCRLAGAAAIAVAGPQAGAAILGRARRQEFLQRLLEEMLAGDVGLYRQDSQPLIIMRRHAEGAVSLSHLRWWGRRRCDSRPPGPILRHLFCPGQRRPGPRFALAGQQVGRDVGKFAVAHFTPQVGWSLALRPKERRSGWRGSVASIRRSMPARRSGPS